MTHTPTLPASPLAPTPKSIPSSAEVALMLLGPSRAMTQLWAQMRRLAPYVRSVLLTGEPDSGQEAVARLMLDLSLHTQRAFLTLTAEDAETRLTRGSSLAALPADLLLFLPEVDRFSPAAQEGLLRLMRTRRSRPFTVVAAAAEDLGVLVGLGRFSAALADALSPIRIAVPSLRQRPEDLPMLAAHLLASYCRQADTQLPRLTEEFLGAAMDHTWTGNLRELTGVLRHLAVRASGQDLQAHDLEIAVAAQDLHLTDATSVVRLIPLEAVIQEHIGAVLQACRGNKLRASEVLGISRSTLYRMLETAAVSRPTTLPCLG